MAGRSGQRLTFSPKTEGILFLEWSEWAIQAGVRPEVIAFLRFRPEMLSVFDRDANAFPSPRSWEFVSRILDSSPDRSVDHELFACVVGTGAATELSAFLRMFRELPNIEGALQSARRAANAVLEDLRKPA